MEKVIASGLKDLLFNILSGNDAEYRLGMSGIEPTFEKKYIVYYNEVRTHINYGKIIRDDNGNLRNRLNPFTYDNTFVLIKFDEGEPHLQFFSKVNTNYTTEKDYYVRGLFGLNLFPFYLDVELSEVVYELRMGTLSYELSCAEGAKLVEMLVNNYNAPIEAQHLLDVESDKTKLKNRLIFHQNEQPI